MKTVVLIDYTTSGHHLAFMRLFAQALLKLKHQVIVMIPESEKVSSWISLETGGKLIAVDFEDINPKIHFYKRINGALESLARWKHAAKKIKQIENEYRIKVDLVFFAWLDSYLANYLHPALVNIIFPYKWSGLYFHPRHLRIYPETLSSKPSISDVDNILTSRNCSNIAIHDEGIISAFTSRLQGKKVLLFPEIADTTAPDEHYSLAAKIKSLAQGRLIVGVIGLEKRKGIITLMGLAQQAAKDEYFFVFAGKMQLSRYGYSEGEQIFIQDFVNSKPENCFFYPDFIEEGAKFNAVLTTFDVPFIVYNEFPSSSNILTKSAYFQKFVIASERFCIGEDVKKYELGLTVEEGNVSQCLEALEIIKLKIRKNDYPKNQSTTYSKLHSTDTLLERFIEIIDNK